MPTASAALIAFDIDEKLTANTLSAIRIPVFEIVMVSWSFIRELPPKNSKK